MIERGCQTRMIPMIKEEVMCHSKNLISPLKIRYFLNENGVLTPYEFRIKDHILYFDHQIKSEEK